MDPLNGDGPAPSEGRVIEGLSAIKRLVQVDQKPIGRTPRSGAPTPVLFDYVHADLCRDQGGARPALPPASSRLTSRRAGVEYAGEGFVCVELLFMPSVYARHAMERVAAKTLEINYRGKNMAGVLAMTVDSAMRVLCGTIAIEPRPHGSARGWPGIFAAGATRH